MTIEEKAIEIEKYCDSINDCSECAINNSENGSFICYSKWDEYPNDIERNYEIVFGKTEDTEEKKKIEHEEEKMTIEEKAKMIEKHCDSMPSCSACPIGSKDGSFVCFSDWEDNPNDIEKNYEIIFGKTSDTKDEKVEKKSEDMVNHPSHYTHGGVECIDAITSALSSYEDSVDSWLVGQVIKYLWRAPLKGKYEEDIKKAQFYLNRLVEKINKNG